MRLGIPSLGPMECVPAYLLAHSYSIEAHTSTSISSFLFFSCTLLQWCIAVLLGPAFPWSRTSTSTSCLYHISADFTAFIVLHFHPVLISISARVTLEWQKFGKCNLSTWITMNLLMGNFNLFFLFNTGRHGSGPEEVLTRNSLDFCDPPLWRLKLIYQKQRKNPWENPVW